MNHPDAPTRITVADAAREILGSLQGGEAVVGVTVIPSELGAESLIGPGAHLLVWRDRAAGTLGDADLDAAAIEIAREMAAGSAPATREVSIPEGGVTTLYVEPHVPPADLVIVGAGHIARPLCSIGSMLGLRVLILDDRPEFATRERFPEAAEVIKADFSAPLRDIDLTPSTHLVLVTRGHKYDFDALRDALRRDVQPAYIGMVGSRRRVRAALEMLAREGIPNNRLASVHAPIGLDLGAETPEEIAVAIAAEIVRLRRGGAGESLRDRERVVERWVR